MRSDPAAVEITLLGLDTLLVYKACVDPPYVKREMIVQQGKGFVW